MNDAQRRVYARLIACLLGVAACLPVSDAAAERTARAPERTVAGVKRTPAAAERTPAAGAHATDSSSSTISPGAAVCPEPAAIVQRLQARYDTTTAFRAAFTHVTTVAALGASEEARGTVAFKKPGRMRWDYRVPQEQLIVSDGTTLWIYQPADHQVLKAPFTAAFVSTTPVSFLAGVGRISDDFNAERDDRGCSAGRIHVKLVPKNTQDLGGLSVAVDATTFDIMEATVTDPIGNVTVLGFADVVRNVDIPDGEFHFEVPSGVDVVAAPGAPAAP